MPNKDLVRSLALLGCCEFLFTATLSIGNTLAGVVGSTLTTNPSLATAPYAAMTLVTAMATVFASFLMRRVGRRVGFLIGGAACLLGGSVAILAIGAGSFTVFCLGYGLIGVFKAFAQYYRFAAAEVFTGNAGPLKARAISLVFIGSFIAAFVGPQLGARARNAVPDFPYAGSFLAIAILGALTILVVLALRLPEETAAPVSSAGSGRSLADLAGRPDFVAAVASCTLGYSAMAFIMAAAPLAVVAAGHPLTDAAFVMQMHFVGMYGPSFFTGRVVGRIGVRRTIAAGIGVLTLGGIVGLSGTSTLQFAVALLCCGVGWNWMYIGGTTLLTETYRPEERTKAQAFNEFVMFAAVTLISFATGWILQNFGWSGVQYVAFAILAAALGVLAWAGLHRSNALQSVT
jgi:MFS family permease